MTDKVTVSILIDPDVYEKIKKLQSDKQIFSRSELIRQIIDAGLKKIK